MADYVQDLQNGLNVAGAFVTSDPMTFILASLAWLFIAILLGVGIWLIAAKGIVWFAGLVVAALVIAVWQIGCKH